MIKNNIVLILGAGASAPYGFPLGSSLMEKAINRLRGQGRFNTLLVEFGFQQELQQQFANELRDSMQPSIDAFVQDRSEFLEIGKAVIAASLIPYENLSDLMKRDFELSRDDKDKRWYEYLLNLLGTRNNFKENNLSIITFNYDRSLEFFLFNAIKPRFHLTDQEATEFLKSIPIVHMYGQLGKPTFLDQNGRDYDTKLTAESLEKSIKEMHLMYENRGEATIIAEAQEVHKLIQKAESLAFLGFGYHEKNMERLQIKEHFKGNNIIGTFFGKAPGEIERDMEIIETYSRNETLPIFIRKHTEAVLEFLKKTNYLH